MVKLPRTGTTVLPRDDCGCYGLRKTLGGSRSVLPCCLVVGAEVERSFSLQRTWLPPRAITAFSSLAMRRTPLRSSPAGHHVLAADRVLASASTSFFSNEAGRRGSWAVIRGKGVEPSELQRDRRATFEGPLVFFEPYLPSSQRKPSAFQADLSSF